MTATFAKVFITKTDASGEQAECWVNLPSVELIYETEAGIRLAFNNTGYSVTDAASIEAVKEQAKKLGFIEILVSSNGQESVYALLNFCQVESIYRDDTNNDRKIVINFNEGAVEVLDPESISRIEKALEKLTPPTT
ncbi:hypothetical protein VZG28_04855 [Synechococcus elongatus IITB4]|uniref:hypothetical protein n=1 Tax=Synechococcus elongatus TaxID=32046 RepID=UPI0030D02860